MAAKRVILLPIDSSEHCKRAFQWYLRNMMRAESDLLVFVHVVEPVYATPAVGLMEAPPFILDDMNKMMEESISGGKQLGQEFMREAKDKGLETRAFIHVDTRPGEALVKSAKDHQADVIVIGNRGVGTLRRTFLGSVSDHILHHAHVPVVVVPPETS